MLLSTILKNVKRSVHYTDEKSFQKMIRIYCFNNDVYELPYAVAIDKNSSDMYVSQYLVRSGKETIQGFWKKLLHYLGPDELKPSTPGSAGIDLTASISEPIVLNSNAQEIIPTGVCLEVPQGFEVQIRPRSGLAAKHGISITNTPGTIDSDYRGEIFVTLINHGPDPFTIDPGMRIAQMVPSIVPEIDWLAADQLSDTERGEGRHGSTGL